MPTYRKPKQSDITEWLIFIGIYVATITLTSFLLLGAYWYVWFVLVAGGLFILVLWHKKSTAHHCPVCGDEFEITCLTYLFSSHGVTKEDDGWTYLKCPQCKNRAKMKILVKENKKNHTTHN